MSVVFRSAVLFFFVVTTIQAYAWKCDRLPDGSGAKKSPADGRFRIRISGNPERYAPGDIYTSKTCNLIKSYKRILIKYSLVSLAGIRSMQIPHKFSGFMLAAEKEGYDGGRDGSGNSGIFQLLGDTLAKFSEKCPNVVTHTSSIPKSDIQVLWTAPPPGSGCIVFRATVIEHRDVWYMDDGKIAVLIIKI